MPTTELHASAWWDTGLLLPGLRAAWDVDELGGVYLEPRVELRVPTLPSRDPVLGLTLGLSAGWSFGQSLDVEQPASPAYYAADGFTHVETLVRLAIGRGDAQLWLELGTQFLRVDGARALEPDGTRTPGSGWWFGVGLADAVLVGRL